MLNRMIRDKKIFAFEGGIVTMPEILRTFVPVTIALQSDLPQLSFDR